MNQGKNWNEKRKLDERTGWLQGDNREIKKARREDRLGHRMSGHEGMNRFREVIEKQQKNKNAP